MLADLPDYDYSMAHRKASEALIEATYSGDQTQVTLEALNEAEEHGLNALNKAENIRQITLSTGLLQTVYAMRLLVQRGYDLDKLRDKR